MKPANPNGKKFEYDNKFSKDPMNLEGIWLYQVGELYAEAGLKMNTHMQDCHEISYIVSGRGYIMDNGIWTAVEEGDLIFTPRGHLHCVQTDASTPLRFCYLGCEFEEYDIHQELNELKLFYGSVKSFCIRSGIEILCTFNKIFEEFYHNCPGQLTMIRSYVLQILILVWRISLEKQTKPLPRENTVSEGAVYAAIKYLDQHAMDVKKLQVVAQNLGYSRCYLSHAFKDRLGMSMREYLSEIKMEKAKELLKGGNVTVTQTAQLLNFSSVQAFSKAFQRAVGIYPSAFLKNFLKKAENTQDKGE